jgi:3-oxoadipate enol-lactonase
MTFSTIGRHSAAAGRAAALASGRLALGAFRRLTDSAMPDLPIPPPAFPVALPGRGTTYVVDIPGPTPEAPVLLLMHGIATTGSLTWFSVMEDLRARYRVITFDQRWHGRGISDAEFSLAHCADDGAAVLEALGVERAVVVGYSMGGASAQELWHRHPDRVAGLVLCSTAARWEGHAGEWLFFRLLRAFNTGVGSMVAQRVQAHAEDLLGPDEDVAAAGLRDWALAELRTTSAWSFPVVMAELGRFDSRGWIGGVDVPTGVLVTARDRAVPTSRQRELGALIPEADVRESPGGHVSLIVDLANWRPLFLDLVADVTAAASGLRQPA